MAQAKQSDSHGSSSFDGKGAMIGAAVAGLAVGLVANLGRKAVVQGMTSPGNWSDGLKAEHEATRKIFDLIEETNDTQTTKRTMLLTQLKHALTKHACEEENVIYPVMRDHGLTEEADHLNHDHGYVKQFLFDLTEMERDNPGWTAKVREFRVQIEEHMREEEEDLFPKLTSALGEEGNAHVTAAMNKEGFKAA